jgi:RHS repeat-associated protein
MTDEDYSFDATGNRTNTGYTTGSNNQLTGDGTFTYEYDDEGNRTKKTNASTSDSIEYTWDQRNRLTKIVENDSLGSVTKQVDYTYDLFDRRIEKSVDADGSGPNAAVAEHFAYDGADIVLTLDVNADVASRLLHGPAIDQVLVSEDALGDILWPLADHLGSVRDIIDSEGNVENHILYNSFGEVVSETDSALGYLFGFTGRERDVESDLQFNRARYYDAAVGRWISEDPIGFAAGDTNLNRYVGNAPVDKVDPWGLRIIVGGEVIGDSASKDIEDIGKSEIASNIVNLMIASEYDYEFPTIKKLFDEVGLRESVVNAAMTVNEMTFGGNVANVTVTGTTRVEVFDLEDQRGFEDTTGRRRRVGLYPLPDMNPSDLVHEMQREGVTITCECQNATKWIYTIGLLDFWGDQRFDEHFTAVGKAVDFHVFGREYNEGPILGFPRVYFREEFLPGDWIQIRNPDSTEEAWMNENGVYIGVDSEGRPLVYAHPFGVLPLDDVIEKMKEYTPINSTRPYIYTDTNFPSPAD